MPDQGSQLDRGEGTAQDQSSSWPIVCDSLCLVSFLFLMAAASLHFSLWLLLHCQVPVSLLTIQAGCVLVQNLKEDVAWLHLPTLTRPLATLAHASLDLDSSWMVLQVTEIHISMDSYFFQQPVSFLCDVQQIRD